MTFQEKGRWSILTGAGIVALLALAKLLLHLFTIHGYGIFRDEFYYLACGRHLAWGYVDQAPFSPALIRLSTALFGESVFGIRLPAALAGAALVLLTGALARELGGGRFAQGLAALAVIVAPVWLGTYHIFNNNAFEPLFWAGAAYLVVRIFQTGNSGLWLWFGLVTGLGLLNKVSTLFFGFGLFVGLLLTRPSIFRKRWIWLGGAVAFLVFLPFLIWQAQNGWPQLEFLRNAEMIKNYRMSPGEFLWSQVLFMNPVMMPLWLGGLYFYFFTVEGKPYRALGWTYVVIAALMLVLHGKAYYMVPAYPMLLAAGATWLEDVIRWRGWNWLKPVAVTVALVSAIILAPLTLPILPVETYLRYSRALGVTEIKTEKHKQGVLPQFYADMFGWQNMAAQVAKVFQALPADEKSKTIIFTQNYGEAGAIDYYGPRYGLPPAVSGHNNYFLWGPGQSDPKVAIVVGGSASDARKVFDQVEKAGVITNPYAMPYENNLPIWVCRKPHVSVQEIWPKVKQYI